MNHEYKIPVAVLGATGMVGQRFATLLNEHPWFELTTLAASPQSAGKTYEDAVKGKWYMGAEIPQGIARMKVLSVEDNMLEISQRAAVVFSAFDHPSKDRIREVEEGYASAGLAVVSNNSAHRWTPDVPMIIPEVNPQHIELIKSQRDNRGWSGLIAVKPNCSLQPFVIPLEALKRFFPKKVMVVTSQALSGAGKVLEDWPEMEDNLLPFIPGEEEKTQKEPSKIWGKLHKGEIFPAQSPKISSICTRVPLTNGHLVSTFVVFDRSVFKPDIIDAFETFNRKNPIKELDLPSSPKEVIVYRREPDRPQTRLDRMAGNGMSVTVGRLQGESIFDWKFVALSHNTIRGAAGGAILTAELLHAKGYL